LALRAISAGFVYPDAGWRARLLTIFERAGPVFAPLLRELRRAKVDALQEAHFRLFGSAAVCPQELAVHMADNAAAHARIMAQMAGFYAAFGVDSQSGVRPDNIAVALEFAGYLQLKRVNAAEKGLAAEAEVTDKARRALVDDVLIPGVTGFVRKLAESSAGPFYAKLAESALREVRQCAA
jgi:nitrate reductase assembly molybdenum cofactor insertion protein NarJ